jgi:type III restriction enzyme
LNSYSGSTTAAPTGLVLWIVPSDAIYSQTWKNLANREHPYRMTLERASGGRVKLLRRGDAFSKADAENYLCVFVMMMAAAARQDTDVLKMFQDTGRYPGFFPAEDEFEAQRALLKLVPNLEILDLTEGAFGGGTYGEAKPWQRALSGAPDGDSG